MSRVIDERILEMSFDNRNFEANVNQSMNTLDKLKNSLNLSSATSGLEKVADTAGSLTLNPLITSAELAGQKLSAFNVAAATVVMDLTHRVEQAGISLAKSLSVDQLTEGWTKYGQKVESVQTIMSATTTTWEENAKNIGFSGSQMEYVSEQLDRLNWFSDETSYSFTDMTNNIGKFTSAGIELPTAVEAMEGISVWAAKSGQNTQAASRAMYNLAQAISVGSVKLMDWRSIENANMATVEFKQTAIDTAVELGTLKKVGDGLYQTLDGASVTVEDFNSQLSTGWFSADVLISTLKDYGSAAQRLSEISQDYGVTATSFLKGMDQWASGERSIDQIARSFGRTTEEILPLFEEMSKEEYKLGLSSFRAAQETKTFRESIEATKDAVSTGWMNTWELIFGNYEESKVIWTELTERLWDVFAASGETRNAILSIWKSDGGRDDLIQSFWNLWDAIDSVVQPIKEAFNIIFRGTNDMDEYAENAGKGLVALTSKLKDFTERLIISDDTADKLSRTFRGLFSIIKMVGDTIGFLASKLFSLLGMADGVGDSILDMAANFGDFLVRVSNTDPIDLFRNAFEKVSTAFIKVRAVIFNLVEQITGISIDNVFNKIISKLKGAFQSIQDIFKSFGKIDLSGLDTLSTNVEKKFSPITFILDLLKTGFSIAAEVFKRLSPVFSAFGKIIKDAFGLVGKALGDLFTDFSFDSLYDAIVKILSLFAGVEFYKLLSGITKTVDTFSKGWNGLFGEFKGTVSNSKGVIGSIRAILDSTKNCMQAWQQDVKAGVLLKIAAAMAILAVAIMALTFVDPDRLFAALAIITTELVDLMVFMRSMNTIQTRGVVKSAAAIVLISVAIAILSSACARLAKLDSKQLTRGIVAVGALMVIVATTATALSKGQKRMMRGTAGLIAMAIAINLLIKPIKKLGEMDLDKLGKGVIALGVILLELAGFVKIVSGSKKIVSVSIGLILLAASIGILAKTINKFGEMDDDKLQKGLIAMALVLVELAAFIRLTSGSKKIISVALGMVVLGAAIKSFAKVVKEFSDIKLSDLVKGLAGMAATLLIVGVAVKSMPKTGIISALGLMLMAASIKILASALKSFGSMKIEEIGKGVLAMGASLLIISLASRKMLTALPGALALLVMANGLLMLALVMKIFGSMKLESIGKSLLTMVGVFAVLGVAGVVLAPLTPLLLALSIVLSALGVSTLACGAGVMLLATALTILAAAGTADIAVIKAYLTMLLELIPVFAKNVGEALKEFLVILKDSAPLLAEAVVAIVEAIFTVLQTLVPRLIEVVRDILIALKDNFPSILDSVISIVMDILKAIRDNVGEVVKIVIDLLINILNAISEKLPDFVEAGVNLVISLIDGIAMSIEKNAKRIRETIGRLIRSIITLIVEMIGLSKDLVESGKELINRIIDGIKENVPKLLNKAKEFVSQTVTKVSESLKEFTVKGRELVSNIISGLGQKIGDIKYEMKRLMDKAIEAVKEKIVEFISIGKNIIDGLIQGIKDNAGKLVDGVKDTIGGAINGAKKLLKINSPSKVFEQFGMYTDEGFVVGINKNSDRVRHATEGMARTAIQTMGDTILSLQDRLDNEMDSGLTITPIMDLTDIQNGVGYLDGLLNDTRTLRMASGIDSAYTANIVANDNNDRLIADLTKQFNNLKDEVGTLNDSISGMKIVMDSGVLVGELSTGMDRALGARAIMAGRRI